MAGITAILYAALGTITVLGGISAIAAIVAMVKSPTRE
jgi:hypothetical protein